MNKSFYIIMLLMILICLTLSKVQCFIIFNQQTETQRQLKILATTKGQKYIPEEDSFQEYESESGTKYIFEGDEYAVLDDEAGIWREKQFIKKDEFEEFFDVANPIIIDPDEITRDSTGLGDFTLTELAFDYNFPIDFFADILCRWGVPAPIQTSAKLKELVNTEQAYALSEALTTLDSAEVYESYIDYSVRELSKQWDIPLKDIIQVCGRNKLNLPLGVKTHLQIDDYKFLMQQLGVEINRNEKFYDS